MVDNLIKHEEAKSYTVDKNGQRIFRPSEIVFSYLQIAHVVAHAIFVVGYAGFVIFLLGLPFFAQHLPTLFTVPAADERWLPIILMLTPLFYHAYYLRYIFNAKYFVLIPTLTQVFAIVMTIFFSMRALVGVVMLIQIAFDDERGAFVFEFIIYHASQVFAFIGYLTIFLSCIQLKAKLHKDGRDYLSTSQTMIRVKGRAK